MNAEASTSLRFAPRGDEEAGLVALQNDLFYFFLAVGAEDGRRVVRLRRRAGEDDPADGAVIASAELRGARNAPVYLRVVAQGGRYSFAYATTSGGWIDVARDLDGHILSTRTAGGFVGAIFGLYAHGGEE